MLGCALLAYSFYVHQLSDMSDVHHNLGTSMQTAGSQ